MADSTPLLSQSKSNSPSLDQTIEQYLGNLNFSQFFIAIFVSFAWAFDAQQMFISVFTEVEPTWHCTNSSCNSNIYQVSLCNLPENSTWEWDKPTYTSVISEWDLQCSSSLLKGLPASSFFFGCLIGGMILATLADSWLGRKYMLFLSCLTMGCSSFLIVFSPNVWVYSGLKFVNGFGRATIGTCALVLATEIVGKKWRGQIGVFGYVFFTFGFLSLPWIAYVNRDSSWRVMYLWTSIPTILYSVLVYFVVAESPRWLFCRGRKEEALSVLRRISSVKSIDFPESKSDLAETGNINHDFFSVINTFAAKSWAFRRLLVVMAMGFGSGIVYCGMPFELENSNFNLYLSTAFNALSEFLASLATFVLIPKLNRKSSLLIFSTISGICSILIVLATKLSADLEILLETVSFFCACIVVNVLMIFVTELFPTSVRNSSLSMVRQGIALGGVIAPMVIAVGRTNKFISYGLFGFMIGISGLCVIFVKETRGETICDTLEEEEYKEAKTNVNA